MGWTGTHRSKGLTNAQYFQSTFFPEADSVILPGSATIDGVFYAAVKTVTAGKYRTLGEVWALIVLTKWSRSDFNFTYKEMSDTSGPGVYDAPASVLDKLTPTDHEYAKSWREKCRENAERKARSRKALRGLRVGDQVILDRPLRFTNGAELGTFAVAFVPDRRGRRHVVLTDGGDAWYRVPRWRERVATVVRGGERIEVMEPSR